MKPNTTRRQSIVLGLFVALAVGVFVASLFTLGTVKELATRRTHVSTTFDQVGGLDRGDAIWFAGVPVGIVKGVELTASGVSVDLALDAKSAQFIPSGVVARIGSDGLIGNPIVQLDIPVDKTGTPIVMVGKIEGGETLESVASVSMDQLMTELQKSNDNVLAITKTVRGITDQIDDGEGSLGKLVKDDQLYTKVNDSVDQLNAAASQARVITTQGAQLAKAMNQPGSLAYDVAHDATTYPKIQASVDQASSAAERAGHLMEVVDQAVTNGDSMVGVLLQDKQAGADLSTTMSNLASGSGDISEAVDAAQQNWLLRPFLTTKEQRKAERRQRRNGGDDSVADAAR